MTWHNHGLNGEPKGYSIDDLPQEFWLWIFPKRPKYRVTINRSTPLYFQDSKGRKLTARYESVSDFGSIPPPADRIWSPSVLRRSAILHDDGCRNVGLYLILDDNSQAFLCLSRLAMDKLWAEMVPEECKLLGKGKIYQWISEHFTFWGVRIGSYLGIGKPDKVEPTNRIDPNGPPIAFA